jgi:hypothetical protein
LNHYLPPTKPATQKEYKKQQTSKKAFYLLLKNLLGCSQNKKEEKSQIAQEGCLDK